MEWVMAHMDDVDFAAPFAVPAAAAAPPPPSAAAAADPAALAMLADMGFGEARATKALKACGGDVERATDWLFSHTEGEEEEEEEAAAAAGGGGGGGGGGAPSAPSSLALPAASGASRYVLQGFVSHMGGSPMSGHYVAHMRKGERWLFFNDSKVALSKDPPLEAGYM